MNKQIYTLLILLTAFLFACKDDTTKEYVGINTIYLESEKDPVLTIGENGTIAIRLKTVQRAYRDTPFHLTIKPLEQALSDWVKIKESNIVLKKGEREITFHLIAKAGVVPDRDLSHFELTIKQMPDERMELKAPLRFRLLNVAVPELTDAQQTLIEGYKLNGINITPFLGKIKVKTTVDIPAGGNIKEFENPQKKIYEGFSVITLSEKSNADIPVLKMVYNPMGMNEFFSFSLKKHTIENYEFWYGEYSGPLFKEIRELIDWNDKSIERFSATLDNIRIGKKQGDKISIEYIAEGVDGIGYPIMHIPFQFEYSAWNRQKKLIDKGNLKAIECHEQGASAYPCMYLNNTDILHNMYDEKQKMHDTALGKWLLSEQKMQFSFLTTVNQAGDYISVTVEYETAKF